MVARGEPADTFARGAAEGAAWAARLSPAELRQAIVAREATGYADGDGYNGGYTEALRVALRTVDGRAERDA